MPNAANDNEPKVDVLVEHQRGSGLATFRLYTQAAKDWVAENLEIEGWQWLGASTLGVDWRYAEPIAAMMDAAGLIVH